MQYVCHGKAVAGPGRGSFCRGVKMIFPEGEVDLPGSEGDFRGGEGDVPGEGK